MVGLSFLLPRVRLSFRLFFISHTASWDSTKIVVEFGPNQTDATILEMKPSTYNLRMFVRNRLGTSKASNVLTITTRESGTQISNCLF